MNFKRIITITISMILLLGCGAKTMGLDPSKPHALLIPSLDEEHNHGNPFGKYSALFVQKVNNKDTDIAFRSRQRNIPIGKVTLVVNEEYSDKVQFVGEISFNAKEGKKYILTSKIKKIGNTRVSSELRIIYNNKIISKTETTRLAVSAPVYIPIYMP